MGFAGGNNIPSLATAPLHFSYTPLNIAIASLTDASPSCTGSSSLSLAHSRLKNKLSKPCTSYEPFFNE